MSKLYHLFNKSQQTEINSAYLHDEIYNLYTNDINKNNNRQFLPTIDRESCNYNTDLGKSYQQADTDVLLVLNCEQTQTSMIKNISEKTRTKYYNDIYIEIISILKINPRTKKYEIQAPGWGLKNEEKSPDCLSMLFLDKSNYTNLFIDQYKLLKEKLFHEELYNTLLSEKFVNWLNNKIVEAEKENKTSFKLTTKGKNQNNVSSVIFAKNQGYYTIGFTYETKHIQSLVNVRKYQGKIVDQNTSNMQY